MSRARIVLGAVALAAVCLGGSSLVASAGKPKLETEITYRNSVEIPDFIHKGRVKSSDSACERRRKVDLYGEGTDEPFASDRTNREGRYRITMPGDGIPEDYYTRTNKIEKADVICLAAESEHKSLN